MQTRHLSRGSVGYSARGLFVGIVIAGLCSCSSNIKKVENTSQRFHGTGFSILPPQEPGWRVKDSKKGKITFFKKGAAHKSSYVVVASSASHSLSFKSEEEFEAIMGKLRISMEFRPKRNVLLDKNVSLATDVGKYCLKSYSKLKDYGKNGNGNGNGNGGYLLMENFGLICIHPDDKTQLVNFAVSYRYPPGAQDEHIKDMAEEILAGVQLEPLHPHSPQ